MSEKKLCARDIMHKNVLTVTPDQSVKECITLMHEHKVGSILIEKNNQLLGIFTERDVLLHSLNEAFQSSAVEQFMTANPTTIDPERSIEDIHHEFARVSFRHLPVCEGKKPVGMISIRDLTRVYSNVLADQRDFIEQQYQRAMGVIVHDLRSPISAVKSINEMILTGADTPDGYFQAGFPSLIDESCETMLALIQDLLEISTLKTNAALNLANHDLAALAHSIVQTLTPSASAKRIPFQLINSLESNRWHFDLQRMNQVITNLVSNAIKYSDKGLPVKLVLEQNNDMVEIQVIDHGQGIAPDQLPHVFDELCKIDSVPTGGEASTGLGLSIAKKLVEAHGGEITAESTPYEKTQFTVKLPLKIGEEASRAA